MSPRREREAAADDVGEWASKNLEAIRHPKRQFTDAEIDGFNDAADAAHPQRERAVLTLSTSELLAECGQDLALRVCRQTTTARDVLLVQALAARLRTLSIRPACNREPLDGMLMLDIQPEAAPALTFERARSAS